MKTPLFVLLLAWGLVVNALGQTQQSWHGNSPNQLTTNSTPFNPDGTFLYADRHKEIEHTYAIIDSGTIEDLTETEKIKYELRYTEKTISKKVLGDYTTEMLVIYDSNGYNKDWLTLPKKILFDNAGKHLIGKNDELLKTLEYSDKQLIDRMNDKIDVENQGYHPGLIGFPEGNDALYSVFNSAGIQYEDSLKLIEGNT